jgi:hypothetical protein
MPLFFSFQPIFGFTKMGTAKMGTGPIFITGKIKKCKKMGPVPIIFFINSFDIWHKFMLFSVLR